MSFTVVLQKNKSEKNRMNKSLSKIMSVSGTLKAETSLIDPIILVNCNLEDVAQCNYATISAFKRKYFVTDIISVRHGLVEMRLHVDVLTTYKSQLGNCTGVTKRQEKKWNLYLNDGSFKIYQNPKVLTKSFPHGFSTMEFVLAVAGD